MTSCKNLLRQKLEAGAQSISVKVRDSVNVLRDLVDFVQAGTA